MEKQDSVGISRSHLIKGDFSRGNAKSLTGPLTLHPKLPTYLGTILQVPPRLGDLHVPKVLL